MRWKIEVNLQHHAVHEAIHLHVGKPTPVHIRPIAPANYSSTPGHNATFTLSIGPIAVATPHGTVDELAGVSERSNFVGDCYSKSTVSWA